MRQMLSSSNRALESRASCPAARYAVGVFPYDTAIAAPTSFPSPTYLSITRWSDVHWVVDLLAASTVPTRCGANTATPPIAARKPRLSNVSLSMGGAVYLVGTLDETK